MGTELIVHPNAEARPETIEQLTERIRAVRDVIARDCTEQELYVFAIACQRTGLDPFSRQIYAIKRKSGMTIQTGIDGFRAVAEDSEKYQGQLGPFWCGADGVWTDAWLKPTPPVAAKVAVMRDGFKEPLWAVARTEAYRVDTNDLWRKMPEVMIAKCAEALALRKAFPRKLSDVHTADEMEQADHPAPRIVEANSDDEKRDTQSVKKTRKWASLQARAHSAKMFESQEEWAALVLRICGLNFDPKKATNEDYDDVEQAIEDKEAENRALATDAIDLHAAYEGGVRP